MVDYSTTFDDGGRDAGPWIQFHAALTRDGIPGGAWSLRDSAGRREIDLARGICFDWPNARTGWIEAGGKPGVAPRKVWNATRSRFEKSPGPDFRRGFQVPVAYYDGIGVTRADWEQNSYGAFLGFSTLMKLLTDAANELPRLPIVGFISPKSVAVGNGSTLVPQPRISRYVARPACLPEAEDWAALANEAAPVAPVWDAPLGGNLDDEISF
jgi:hypothetical protein